MFLQSVDTCWGDPKIIKWSTTELIYIPISGGIPPAGCNRNNHDDSSPIIEFKHVRVVANKTTTGEEEGVPSA